MRLRGRPQAAAAARRAAPCGPGLVACRGGRGGEGGPQAGPSGRTAPAGEARRAPAKPGRLRPVARLMLKCAEGQGIVTGK